MRRWGTCHFVSRPAAERYYATYGVTKSNVANKIDEGEIRVGPPQLKPGQRLSVIRDEGRYQITEDDDAT